MSVGSYNFCRQSAFKNVIILLTNSTFIAVTFVDVFVSGLLHCNKERHFIVYVYLILCNSSLCNYTIYKNIFSQSLENIIFLIHTS